MPPEHRRWREQSQVLDLCLYSKPGEDAKERSDVVRFVF